MNYYQLDDCARITTSATSEDIWLAVGFMVTMVKPQHHKYITIHICGKNAHISLIKKMSQNNE